ncbi:hypothetical protein Y1Q_0015533 [Alligator mississippiensis]|uniref:Uncharacterized protein n=1 Tax=Alligator mississippiensis TaxID=8496 RepID=A0A151NN86_ALLMI|nr:hypothetical protein Y1Q_0015533 [Alligator mississippiensis]
MNICEVPSPTKKRIMLKLDPSRMKLETPVDLLGPDTEQSALKSNLRNIVRGMLLTYDCLLHPSFPTIFKPP